MESNSSKFYVEWGMYNQGKAHGKNKKKTFKNIT